MANKIEQYLAARGDDIGRNALHIAAVFNSAFSSAANHLVNGRLDAASGVLRSVAESPAVQSVIRMLSAAEQKISDFMNDLERVGGPLAKLVIGLVAIPAGYFVVKGALGVALMVVGVLVAYSAAQQFIDIAYPQGIVNSQP